MSALNMQPNPMTESLTSTQQAMLRKLLENGLPLVEKPYLFWPKS